ncbi:MAG: zinc ribbon domain-containing protein [Clostridia bacterium]|nr:zinc ribbon domain-containing protein [Clostridia bacterium]
MEDIFESLKKGAVRAMDGAEKVTKTVIKKSAGLVEQTKLNFAISETEDKINDVLCQIGKYVYEKYKNGAEFSDFAGEKCIQIDELYREIDELKKKVAQTKNAVVCPSCGKYNSEDDKFCSNCGETLKD